MAVSAGAVLVVSVDSKRSSTGFPAGLPDPSVNCTPMTVQNDVETETGASVPAVDGVGRRPVDAGYRWVVALDLPFQPPIEPMLAKAADSLPTDEGWLFEPKWDGFRALVFRDGDEVYTQSRDLTPLDRYFPELADPLRAALPDRCVIDGEVVIARDGALDFEALLLRIHPAASRVRMLAEESPASFVAWDLLALSDEDLRDVPQGERRARLETVLGAATAPIHLTPATQDRATAADWFERFEGAGLDGVVAKRLDAPYQPGKRAMLKIKHQRTADCVVAGFRWHKNGPGTHVGSLLLGLYDDEGTLHHVGVTSSFSWDRRAELVDELAPLRENALEGHPWGNWAEWAAEAEASGQRVPGATSRWNRGKDLSWEPLRAERVAEVAYDHLQGDRFRHGTTFKRWRPDKPASACRYDQLEETAPFLLAGIFGASA
jgi:ATP-dependent DNA ligase